VIAIRYNYYNPIRHLIAKVVRQLSRQRMMNSLQFCEEPGLVLPEFLSSDFYFDQFITVNIEKLYVGLLSASDGKVMYLPIFKTPHYHFAKNAISGGAAGPITGYESYKDYAYRNRHMCSEEEFIELIENMRTHGYDWQNKPIFVFRHWSRPFPIGRWDVADGFHRLAILAALGEKKVKVGILRYKHSFIERLKRRLYCRK